MYNLPLTSTRRAYKPPNGCNGGTYWNARKRTKNGGTLAAVRLTSCNGRTQGASLAACSLCLWNAANVYQYAASTQGARMRATHGTSRAALAIRVPCLCTLYGVHRGTCARFVALFIKHNSTTYSHTTPGHGSHCERVDCTLSVPPMVGGFGVRYVEIKDFACGSSMVCRKTANRSMRIVRLVGIKPLHSIGV